MRWTRWTVLGLTFVAAAGAVGNWSCTTAAKQAAPVAMTAEDKVVRGKYLVSVMGCTDCHTPGTLYGAPDETRMLSGSELGWHGPWGVVYPANLTPDAETGLGNWTDEQIVTALRTGNRPDGRQLAPIMPWMNFANLTDDDAYSIAAYLKSLPVVSHESPAPIPPNGKLTGAMMVFPPPPAWDAMNLPPPPAPH